MQLGQEKQLSARNSTYVESLPPLGRAHGFIPTLLYQLLKSKSAPVDESHRIAVAFVMKAGLDQPDYDFRAKSQATTP